MSKRNSTATDVVITFWVRREVKNYLPRLDIADLRDWDVTDAVFTFTHGKRMTIVPREGVQYVRLYFAGDRAKGR